MPIGSNGNILVRLVAMGVRFRPVRLLAVMQMHPVFDETWTIVEMQEWITLSLFEHGRYRYDAVVVARANKCIAWQPLAQPAQALIHLFGITAAKVAAPAAEYEQRIASQHLITQPIAS